MNRQTLPTFPIFSARAVLASIGSQLVSICGSCLAPKAAVLLGHADMPLREVNAYALMAYGFVGAAILIAATLRSANDGQKVDKKFASIWLPVKSALMISWLIPLTPEGATCAQIIGKALLPGLLG